MYCKGLFTPQKTFDSLNRSVLLKKLEEYSVTGQSKSWLCIYLLNRKQFVYVNILSSSISDVEVPHWCTLGPLESILFVKDLVRVLDVSKIYLYADEICATVTSPNLASALDTLNVQVKIVFEWIKDNNLILNATKSSSVIFIGTWKKYCKVNINCLVTMTGRWEMQNVSWSYTRLMAQIPRSCPVCFGGSYQVCYVDLNIKKLPE